LADGVAATPDTRNLVTGNWKAGKGTAEHLFGVLQNGLEGTAMVSFKSSISKNKRWAIVHYIRSITKNKTDDDAQALEAFAQKAD
jgi:mono/diheme cytochrome c family protein